MSEGLLTEKPSKGQSAVSLDPSFMTKINVEGGGGKRLRTRVTTIKSREK